MISESCIADFDSFLRMLKNESSYDEDGFPLDSTLNKFVYFVSTKSNKDLVNEQLKAERLSIKEKGQPLVYDDWVYFLFDYEGEFPLTNFLHLFSIALLRGRDLIQSAYRGVKFLAENILEEGGVNFFSVTLGNQYEQNWCAIGEDACAGDDALKALVEWNCEEFPLKITYKGLSKKRLMSSKL